MEKAYWLGRTSASLKSAQDATSAEARLIHYELAGRYSLNALSVETRGIEEAGALPPAAYTCAGKAAPWRGDVR